MKISEILFRWYKKEARTLPWRKTSDPYLIWLSEIILQQTRVNQGLPYYLKFADRFHDIGSMADASEEEILKLWQGLGYYSRARNMHVAARQVVDEFGGKFPGNYKQLLTLKGVGSYTAAAVASMAFNEPVAVVDGNVARVISRLFALEEPINSTRGKRILQEVADDLLDRTEPGIHNQAMMEFGAMQCVPVNPDCQNCPLVTHCLAHKANRVHQLPSKIKKARPGERFFTYALIDHGGFTYLKKREGNDIWKSMYEYPMIESDAPIQDKEIPSSIFKLLNTGESSIHFKFFSEPVKHILSHRIIYARFIHIEVTTPDFASPNSWFRIPVSCVGDFPLPRLIDRYLESL